MLEQAIEAARQHPHWGLADESAMREKHDRLAARGFQAETVTEFDGRPSLKMVSTTQEAYLFGHVAHIVERGHLETCARLDTERRAWEAAETERQVEAWHQRHPGHR